MVYSSLKVDRIHNNSLVYYGTNSRVTSEDIYIRFMHLDQKVDIYSIDNYEIISFLLVTARGVTCSTIRDVIIILY